eukprot:RCo023097
MGHFCSKQPSSEWPRKRVPTDPQYKWSFDGAKKKAAPQPPPAAGAASSTAPADAGAATSSATTSSPKKDPSYYQAKALKDSVFSRGPGTVTRQQIQADGCENCDFLLCDCLDSVLADDCKNCRFFIGPTAGRVFLRTCV